MQNKRVMSDSLMTIVKTTLLYVNPEIDAIRFYGNVLIYLVFFIWGWQYILMDLESNEIASSFMHNINLVFHEAGHVFFRLLGDFMTVLGGSLFQMIMPLVVIAAFVFKNQDNFGASIGLWWLGQSMMDIAPYINDAKALELMLLGGGTGADRPGSHDWENILMDLNMLEYDHSIATMADASGSMLMILAFVWGATILLKQYQYKKV